MLDPTKLKAGQSIQLKQVQGGKWQEWLIDKDGNIVAVEDIDPFKYSKEKAKEPNNYEDLKKNYVYLRKKKEETPIPYLELPEPLDNEEMEPPESGLDCVLMSCERCGCEYSEGNDHDCPDADIDREYSKEEEEPDPETERDIDQEIEEQKTKRK